MDAMKLQLLEEILEHLSSSQGNDLKSLLDESKKPPMEMGMDGKPKGLEVEKVSVMGRPDMDPDEKMKMDMDSSDVSQDPGEEDMTDDELQELLGKYLK